MLVLKMVHTLSFGGRIGPLDERYGETVVTLTRRFYRYIQNPMRLFLLRQPVPCSSKIPWAFTRACPLLAAAVLFSNRSTQSIISGIPMRIYTFKARRRRNWRQ